MKLKFCTSSIIPMYNWLINRKEKNIKDKEELNNILDMDDYKIEFLRYGEEGLPVCNINKDEVIDFFMNFDIKEFSNARLQYKKEYFVEFYNNIESKLQLINMFNSINDEDINIVMNLLKNGLPNKVFNSIGDFNVLLTISIGNSFGWPYKNNIHFDVCNLDIFENRDSFSHVLAHEIHHTLIGECFSEVMTPQEMFISNFAFEGLAVHFNNNARTLYKKSKYDGDMYTIDLPTWDFFENEFEELFIKIKDDYYKCKNFTEEQVDELINTDYHQFVAKSLKTNEEVNIKHYCTYYMGCYFWGIIDEAFGKEVLFDTLKNPSSFVSVYNDAVKKIGNIKYLL